MYRYKKKKVDIELFKGDDNSHITKFNLPQKVFYCKKCNYFWPESEQVNIENITKDYQCN